jgi:class 3 adenylate cyclase
VQKSMKRKIAAILAADVAGYSRLVAEDEEATLTRLAAFREVFRDFVGRAGGRIFNTAGDSVMCEFESAVECVRAAIDIQESLRTRNLPLPSNRRLQFRIGITIGDVVERDGDLLGDAVNIAARLESLAPPGGICVSRSVHEAVANKVAVPFRDIGRREVKNIPNPVHAFIVAWPSEEISIGAAPRGPSRARPRWPWLAAAGGAIAVAAGLAVLTLLPPPPADPPVKAVEAARPSQSASSSQPRPTLPAEPAAAYAALARQGGIVPEPKTVAEHYHNARLHEARGDTVAARRAYHALAAMGQERLDPHLRYSALLRVQDGRAGAREAYSALLREKPTRAAELVHAMQFEGAERRAKIAAVVGTHPDFAPAAYLLAEEYGEDRTGRSQTIDDRRIELEALKAFLKAEQEGRLAAFFLDQSVLAAWLDKARERQGALESYFENTPTTPTATFSRSNSGWTVSIVPPEAATLISYRVGEAGDFRPTGHTAITDQRTGKAAPKPSFELPKQQDATTLHVMYEDANGRLAGPFPIAFDPKEELLSQQRDALDRSPDAWVEFGPGGRPLVYFSHLLSHRCALDRAIMAIDDGPLDIELPIPPCDEKDPFAIPPDAKTHLGLPREARAVSVQLFFADGRVSDVKTFSRE